MIHTESQVAKFQAHFTNGTQVATTDATLAKGGGNLGFTPYELLEAALASSMNMSLRIFAEKHSLPLSDVSVTVSLNRNNLNEPSFEYCVELRGPLSEEQKQRLLSVLEDCPVRNTLSKRLSFRFCGCDIVEDQG